MLVETTVVGTKIRTMPQDITKVVPHLLLQVGEGNFQMLVADTIEVDINLDSTAIMITSVRTVENLVTQC